MERVEAGQPFGVIVDFAHSPASLQTVLDLLAPLAASRGGGLIAVFGSAGERDTAKRPLMGRIAGERCRIVVVTDEDPRGEDRDAILDEIARGAEAAGKRRGHDLLRHRRPAGRPSTRPSSVPGRATSSCSPGKGHEQSIIGPGRSATVGRACRGRGRAAPGGVRLRRYPCGSMARPRTPKTDRQRPTSQGRRRQDQGRDRRRRRDRGSRAARPSPSRRSHGGQGPDLEALRAALYAAILEEHPGADLEPVGRAFDLAVAAHEGQRRATGEPYVTHPIASAQILAELGHRPDRDPGGAAPRRPRGHRVQPDRRRGAFGSEVAQLVDGVTKLSKFSTHSHEQQQAENIRKMLLAMAEDIRVVLIKLADRLHNMRTLYGLPSEKQQRIARQTMEIYAPLAERLGIWQMKWELEDLAFKALEPERFRELAKLLDTRRKGRETLHRPRHRRAHAASSRRPASRPTSRAARSTSTASGRRWSARARSSARSTTSTPSASSSTRSATATPRSASSTRSGARSPASSTTTSRSPRTTSTSRSTRRSSRSTASRSRSRSGPRQMHQVQRGRHRRPLALQGRHQVRPRVRRQARLAAPAARLAARRLGRDRVRRGHQARHLPGPGLRVHARRATSRTCRRAPRRSTSPTASTPTSATGRSGPRSTTGSCPLDYRLKNGDIVEIVTTKGEHGPSRDWLNVVRTSHAREKIRQWFKRKDRDENIVHGRESLERELRRLARTSIAAVGPDAIADVAKHYNYDTLDDFYAAIGYGAISAQSVVMRLGVVDDAPGHAADGRAATAARRGPAASGSRASATSSSASPSAATRSRATRSSASSPAARA